MSSTEPKAIQSYEDLPDLALVPEVAQFFRTGERAIRRWIREGEFPNTFRDGKVYLIPKEDVLECARRKYGKR